MASVEHTLIVRCDTTEDYNWVLAQLQAATNDPNNPIQSIHPFPGQKRMNVTFLPKIVTP